MTRTRGSHLACWSVLVLLLAFVALPARGVDQQASAATRGLGRFSQSVATRYWLANPDQAPEALRGRFQAAHDAAAGGARGALAAPASVVGDRFNRDVTGLPQNEESVAVCRSRPNVVLGGTNDYRGLLDPLGNFTGWHLSLNGGGSVAKEGLLPAVQIGGADVPSGGDPVDVASAGCRLYAGSLNYDPADPFHRPNGVGVYRSDPATLAGCPGGADPACWPTRRAVVVAQPSHFLDKEWIHVGRSGAAGTVVWATYSDFTIDDAAPLGFTRAEIFAVRCTADLASCTDPIPISVDDQDVQFSDVTVGPDGRTYISWAQIQGELEQTPQTFVVKLRVAEPGSTTFGPERVVAVEPLAIPFDGDLHANDFRIATYPKNDVRIVGGKPRVFVVWDACRARPLDAVCEESVVKLRYSDNLGATWSAPRRLSAGVGEHYFPTISSDRAGGGVAVAWFTNRFDPIFHNRQDVELVTLNPATGAVVRSQRLTSPSNEPEADPLLGGGFIGDYIEVFAHKGTAWVHYNANYTQLRLLGEGFPIAQQDNYLTIRSL
jgi:hypothetical protein